MFPSEITTLPNGQLVCEEHYSVWCPYCCVDFSFMQEDEENDEDEEENQVGKFEEDILVSTSAAPPRSQDRGRPAKVDGARTAGSEVDAVPMLRFQPASPNDTPSTLFAPGRGRTATIPAQRFVRRSDPRELLIFTDGACLSNGTDQARAGFGFVWGPESTSHVGSRLETRGPNDSIEKQTSNRAELRAVIAALEFRSWACEGFRKVVIATDSSYVVDGATERLRHWRENGWLTARREPVKNRDLWEKLLRVSNERKSEGLVTYFWLIPRSWNAEADRCAGMGAEEAAVDCFTVISGVLC